MLVKIWAVMATVIAAALAVFHFANPDPLIQIPDRGHRLFFVPEKDRGAIIDVLGKYGLHAYGTFTADVQQTLMDDGVTVIASGTDVKAAISLPDKDPRGAAVNAMLDLRAQNIPARIAEPSDAELRGKMAIVILPDTFGWNIAFRLPGYEMPKPRWE